MTTPTTVSVRLQLRADTAANWTSANPTLLANELGRETDTGKIKIGDGSTAWSSLAYQAWATLPIAVASGGTGQTSYTNGQLLIGNTTGNTLTKATLTAGSGIAITNGTGSITVAASGIADAQIAADAEIAVSKLADGAARQLLQTDAAGTGVEWASNIDIPGTLDVTSAATFDSTIGASAGTASLPSITFTGDLNTGIYSPGADQVAISTNGTGRLFVDASGNVGVGTTPSAAFHVSSAGGEVARFTATNNPYINFYSGSTNTAYIQSRTTDLRFASVGALPIIFQPNEVERLRITSAGLVGVGNSSPSSLLHIGGGAAGITQSTLQGGTVVGDYAIFAIQNGSTMRGRLVGDASVDALRIDTGGGASTKIQFYTGSSYTNAVTIDSSQRVGIGTSSPTENLTIYGTSSRFAVTGGAGSSAILIGNQNGSGANNPSVIEAANGALYFGGGNSWSGGGTFDYTMTLTNDNKVGIGTTSPGANLHVATTGNAEVLIGGTQTPLLNFVGGAGSDPVIGYAVGALRFGTITGAGAAGFSEKARLDTSGRLLVGTSNGRNGGYADPAQVQIEGLNYNTAAQSIILNSNDGNGASLNFAKSRGTTLNSFTVVQNGDRVGVIDFSGADGSTLRRAAVIEAFVDGTPGANDMPGRLVFSTTRDGQSSPSEACRIDSSQRLLVGRTGPDGSALIQAPATSSIPGYCSATGVATAVTHFEFRNSNGLVGTISTNASATAYNTSSDYRLKENVAPVTDGITRLQQLKPSRFSFIADPTKTVDGFLAHEAAEVVPECVTGEKDAVDDEGNPVYQGIDQSKLVPLLTAALQEAIGEIESLKARVAALESA